MLRSDAIATLYFFHPLRGMVSSGRTGVPILMYHSVSERACDLRRPYYHTVTSSDVFAGHMQLLQENGFSTVSVNDAVKYLETPNSGDCKPVVITFDDGYRDFLTGAFPILERFRFSATVFLPTGMIGESRRTFKSCECLTWPEVRELHGAGIQFGSHTVTHPQLKLLDWTQIRSEIRSSKEEIENRLGCALSSFSYPYAFPETDRLFTERLRTILEETGYENGVSTMIGTANRKNDRFFLKRLPVNSFDTPRLFRAKLEGAYDWLHTLQYASKLVKERA